MDKLQRAGRDFLMRLVAKRAARRGAGATGLGEEFDRVACQTGRLGGGEFDAPAIRTGSPSINSSGRDFPAAIKLIMRFAVNSSMARRV